MDKKIKALHVGVNGIPFNKSASINRCMNIYSILIEQGVDFTILNNEPTLSIEKIEKTGSFNGFKYKYTSLSPNISKYFMIRRISKFIGRLLEFYEIFKMGLRNNIDVLFYYPSGKFIELIFYRIASKLFGFKILSHYAEYRTAFEGRSKIIDRINDKLFDNYFMFYVDGVIPISDYLVKNIRSKSKNLPLIKIPPIVDFKLFSEKKMNNPPEYFLYVGSTGYIKAIEIIIESFELIQDCNYCLQLVLHGNLENVKKIVNLSPKKNNIQIKSNLDFKDLAHLYINARALLIPLTNSIQDRARFPQKISEYSASKSPIITTCFGEITNYFKDNVNAFIATDFNADAIALKMISVIEKPVFAKKVGVAGYNTGLKYFNRDSYKDALYKYVLNLVNN